MLVSVLASGSEGNSTYINTGTKKILIDIGMNYKYIKEKLAEINVSPNEIDFVLITHTHKDHIGAMKTFFSHHTPYVYLDTKMLPELDFLNDYPNLVFDDNNELLDNFSLTIFKTSHDAPGARGYIIKCENESTVYVTDTGYINHKFHELLSNHTYYVFESNHDIELLMHGRYPSWLKKRVSSDLGHLSNSQAAFYLSRFVGPDTKEICLAHLSKENNDPELALSTIKDYFKENNIKFDNFIIAKQRERVDL